MWMCYREEGNRCLFLRVDIVLHGATYVVVFTDTDQMPPPYRVDNFAEVCSYLCYFLSLLHLTGSTTIRNNDETDPLQYVMISITTVASTMKDVFDQVSMRNVINFIKETNFYNLL